MTTYNHTGVAIFAAVLSQDSPPLVKVGVGAALLASHLVLDIFPHKHWYDYKNIRGNWKNMLGATLEVGGGLIILPLALGLIFNLNLWWLATCVILASGLDILVGLNVGWAKKINDEIHFWEKDHFIDTTGMVVFEVLMTIFIYLLVYSSLKNL